MHKKIIKSLIIFIGILLLGFHSEIVKAQATNDYFYNGNYISNTYVKKVKSDGTERWETAIILKRSDGLFAYCLQPFLDFKEGNIQVAHDSDYALVTHMTQEQWNRVSLLSYYGYGYGTHKDDKWYIITQMMIWQTVDPTGDYFFTKTLNGTRITRYEDEMAELDHLVSNHSVIPSFSGTHHTLSIGSSLTLTDQNGVLSEYSMISRSNAFITKDENSLHITGTEVGNYTVELVKNATYYNAPPIVYVDSEGQDMLVAGNYSPIYTHFSVQVVGGRIQLTKVDNETNATTAQGEATLVGAVYHVFDSKNNVVAQLTIDENKTAITDILPFGEYTIREVSSSTGYYLDGTVYSVTVDSTATKNVMVKEQVIKGRIQLTKVDSETNQCKAQGEATLVGAKYGIYDSQNRLVDTLTIGSDCQATSKLLPYGNYTIKELTTSTGYKIDVNVYSAQITSDQTVTVLSKESVIKGRIQLTKVDSETNQCKAQGEATLVGAKYGIYDSQNRLVDTLTIGNDCQATSKLLPYGNYTIRELKNSQGYYINTEIYFTKVENEEVYSMTVTEDVIQNDFVFYKFYGNLATGFIYAEPAAVFEIFNWKNERMETFQTDSNGYAKVTLPYGKYLVKQISGLSDYKMMQPFSIDVNETTALTQVNYIKNGPITARLKLIKRDFETKEIIPMAGAKFKIKDIKTNQYVCFTTNQVICEFETDEQGIMITPLPLFGGDYIIEEMQAPDGYLLSTEPVPFSIKENTSVIEDSVYGSIIEVVFENQAVKGVVEIQKIGEQVVIEDGRFTYQEVPLSHVKFGLYDVFENLIGIYVTDFNGYVKIENLKLGKYFLKELETADAYLLDPEIYAFELKYQDQQTPIVYQQLRLKNYLKKGTLEFMKKDIDTGEVIPNVTIEIYTEENALIFSGTTDSNGMIRLPHLWVGRFYIIETEPMTGYQFSNDKIYFEIKENDEEVKVEMSNEKIKGTLSFTKIDATTKEVLPNVWIEIYNAKTNTLVCSQKTDEKGQIVIHDLEYGDYYLLEKEAPTGYTLYQNKIYFEIKENGEEVKVEMSNEKIVEVPDTAIHTRSFLSILGSFCFCIGLGCIRYAKKTIS